MIRRETSWEERVSFLKLFCFFLYVVIDEYFPRDFIFVFFIAIKSFAFFLFSKLAGEILFYRDSEIISRRRLTRYVARSRPYDLLRKRAACNLPWLIGEVQSASLHSLFHFQAKSVKDRGEKAKGRKKQRLTDSTRINAKRVSPFVIKWPSLSSAMANVLNREI